jgi:hypothetical protein
MSKFAFGVDAGATCSLGPTTGWPRSVLPFTGLRLRRAPPRCLLPEAAGRGESGGLGWTAVRASGRRVINSGRSTGKPVAT